MCPAPWNNDPLPSHLRAETPLLSPTPEEKQPQRSYPITHPPVDAPICVECQALELTFFDPTCKACRSHLIGTGSSIGHVFAAMRQWIPQVQQNIEFLIEECLRRGAHPDDRDSLTDMSLLMYACKAGADGVGNVESAARITQRLLDLGADTQLTCKWTNMSAVHYAAYFDVAPVLQKLLTKSKGVDVDMPCEEYENGTALHIAAANISVNAAQTLLDFGADRDLKDDLARTPVECLPDPEDFEVIPDTSERIEKMEQILTIQKDTREDVGQEQKRSKPINPSAVSGKTAMKALGFKVGDRVIVHGSKLGTLRFCGMTDFAPGVWAGIELDSAEGKNNGSVKGVVYFRCQDNFGIFIQASKVSKVGRNYREEQKPVPRQNIVNHGKVDTRHVSSRLNDRLNLIEEKADIRMGDRVKVLSQGKEQIGVVRFIGQVDFVQGEEKWFGIELDEPVGRHDGTVQGVRYFAAAPDTGVFVTESKLTKLIPSVGSNHSLKSDTTNVKRRDSLSSKFNASRVSVMSAAKDAPPASITSSAGSRALNKRINFPNTQITEKESGWKTVSVEPHISKFKKKVPKKYLEPGMSVICIHNKEMGVVKYVGRVDFASGIWVGLELRNPIGKHDGIVEGKRYFQGKPKHGCMIKPKKISVHGINGEDLLKPASEYPF